MSKDRRPKPHKDGLSEEDALLWRRVAASAKPLKRRLAGTAPTPVAGAEGGAESAAGDPELRRALPPRRHGPARVAGKPAVAEKTTAPPLSSLPPREARQIAGGRQSIDGRVDLHGMRQGEAHTKLRSFLRRAQARGDRTVLVITGKGGPSPGDASNMTAPDRERGVLRRVVPQWLAAPELRALVVGFTSAHPRHGGEGALYVRLRRAARLP